MSLLLSWWWALCPLSWLAWAWSRPQDWPDWA